MKRRISHHNPYLVNAKKESIKPRTLASIQCRRCEDFYLRKLQIDNGRDFVSNGPCEDIMTKEIIRPTYRPSRPIKSLKTRRRRRRRKNPSKTHPQIQISNTTRLPKTITFHNCIFSSVSYQLGNWVVSHQAANVPLTVEHEATNLSGYTKINENWVKYRFFVVDVCA
jgi:hypothetical protein